MDDWRSYIICSGDTIAPHYEEVSTLPATLICFDFRDTLELEIISFLVCPPKHLLKYSLSYVCKLQLIFHSISRSMNKSNFPFPNYTVFVTIGCRCCIQLWNNQGLVWSFCPILLCEISDSLLRYVPEGPLHALQIL